MIRKICNILVLIIVLCALGLAALLGIPLVQGNELYAVQTASMEPTYPVDSIVVVQPASGWDVAVGDVITYEASGFDTMVTHRVIEVDAENNQLITKGDNNASADFYPVPMENVRGRVLRGIPQLGSLVSGIRTTGGIIALLWVVLGVIILLALPDIVDKLKGTEKQEAPKAHKKKYRKEGAQ